MRTATILLQMDLGRHTKIVHERDEYLGVCAGPGVNRLIVVTNREHVAMVARERAHHSILHGVQVLELVDQYHIPASANRRSGIRVLQ